MVVSEEDNELSDSNISDNYDLTVDTNIPTRTKWEENNFQEPMELARNPSDTRRTRSQFESVLCMKDPLFEEKCYLMLESDPQTYEYP